MTKLAKDQMNAHALAAALLLSPSHEVTLEPWTLVTGAALKNLSDIAAVLGCVVTPTGEKRL